MVDYYPDALPRPEGYGMAGDLRLPRHRPELPEVQPPDFQRPRMPDLVKAQLGAGDKAVVGDLLRIANGEPATLSGIPSTYATRLLQSWGYPTAMDAWTADQWKQAIDAKAAETSGAAALMGALEPVGY